MKRREFITLRGATAASLPLVARAQQPERMRRIGMLTSFAADDPESQARLAAFNQALEKLGWTDGRNVRIDIRWAAGNAADIRKYAVELVALAPDVIFVNGAAALELLLQATRSVPIVFAVVADPVGSGFVDRLVADVKLRGRMDDWEVAKQAREINPAFPVIYMTGGSAGQWPSLGVPNSILLEKPFAPAQLVTAVSQPLINRTTKA